jgi:SAM-dependent methyltransferase
MDIQIVNPKIYADRPSAPDHRLFPYYAGYSADFADKIIASLRLPENGLVLDPWNGSGTTTNAAAKLGYSAVGFDLNPVMVLVAKSALVSVLDLNNLVPLAETICERAAARISITKIKDDPLGVWFAPAAQAALRTIEREINQILFSHHGHTPLKTSEALEQVTPLAAFFYVALFRIARGLIADFIPTNPTWVKKPTNPQQRKQPSQIAISETFISEARDLAEKLGFQKWSTEDSERVHVALGNAEKLPLPRHSVDAVVTSPPYCTRIDYAVATAVESNTTGKAGGLRW